MSPGARASRADARRSFRAAGWAIVMLALFLPATALLLPATARAGEIEDFQTARAAYDAHDWPRAVLYFEALVGSDPPTLRTPLLVLESRKYLAAAYVFVGRTDAARAQLERLLVMEPAYELDATQFPIEVVELFSSVRDELAEERVRATERAEAASVLERERERARALVALAEEEVTLEVENSRWLAIVPFGVGQFQNQQDDLGWLFLVTESITAVSAMASLFVHDAFQSQFNTADRLHNDELREQGNQILRAMQIVNWTSFGLCAVFAIAGVIQAQVDFLPTHVVRTRREVPDPLRRGLEARITPGGFALDF